ncbi:MAG: hypothetical protein Q9196_007397 [Gyalolechia fulgens]
MLGTTPVLTQQDSISRVGSCPAASAATVSSMTVIAGRFVDGANVATVRDAALTGLNAVRLRLVPVVLVPAAAVVKGLALGESSAPRTFISLTIASLGVGGPATPEPRRNRRRGRNGRGRGRGGNNGANPPPPPPAVNQDGQGVDDAYQGKNDAEMANNAPA